MKHLCISIFIVLITGCTAFRFPSEFDSLESKQERKIAVSVTGNEISEERIKQFKRSLKASGILVVENRSQIDRQVWEIKLNGPYVLECFAEPMFTVLTLGIIPYIGCKDIGFEFDLIDPRQGKVTHISTKERIHAIWGWAALTLFPFDVWHGERDLSKYESQKIYLALKSAEANSARAAP